jgi:pyruvate,orthophosphate dikinase
MMRGRKYVYPFEEADPKDKQLLGGKGVGLAEMTQMGLPVPPGFIITTEACLSFYDRGKKLPEDLMDEVEVSLKDLEGKTGKGFGNPSNPLLVSVRSGAAVSMPGMMDTVLNLGLSDEAVKGLAERTGDERFAYDAYRRFIQLFGKVALGVDEQYFDVILNETKRKYGAEFDADMDAEALAEICREYKKIVRKETRDAFPEDPNKQLELAIEAVFRSWMGKRAVDYRKRFKITPDIANGTAVNVCTMVFGNMGPDSATGVAFTRDPSIGENAFYGEYLTNAQGEDVVAGIRTPKPIHELGDEMPPMYDELERIRHLLETRYREVQDFEFTIERGKLYILQTRNGKMTAPARIKTSREMVEEGLISQKQGLLRVDPEELEQLLHRRIDSKAGLEPKTHGIAASPGAATGRAIFDTDEAERRGRLGEDVILVREETKPEDVHGFIRAKGILTSRGGKTSHAAVVARAMGKPCVVGCEDLFIDVKKKMATFGSQRIAEGEFITIDGSTGNVYQGRVPTVEPEFDENLETILEWADDIRVLGVMANADTPADSQRARKFGAEGIGLCRTERMFNAADRLPIVIEMILADSPEVRMKAVEKLFPMQKADFKEILKAMEGLPVTIRLLDPPLHEFLPSVEELTLEIERLREFHRVLKAMEDIPDSIISRDSTVRKYVSPIEHILEELSEVRSKGLYEELIAKREMILRKVKDLHEINPMLGHRGVRLGITYPEIYEMQMRAILEATAELMKDGVDVQPEIMVPQVCTGQELKWVYSRLAEIKEEVEEAHHIEIHFKFGTMIEVVRACMRAGRLAEIAEFFSFGTNDLTQATFSFSREDAESKFLPLYNERNILQDNPFEVLDVKGVGRLMMITMQWGRRTRPDLKVGICGEHGGQPRSIEFCHNIGLDYVSCSGYRVPMARLAAAQARIKEEARKSLGAFDPFDIATYTTPIPSPI